MNIKPEDDPLLALCGSGKGLWTDEHADKYVRRIREGWDGRAARDLAEEEAKSRNAAKCDYLSELEALSDDAAK